MKKKIRAKIGDSKLLQSDFGETLKHTWTYLSGSVALKSLSIIGIPIMTRLLTEEDYGILNIFFTYTVLAATIFTLNTHVGTGRYYFENNQDFKSFFGTSLVVSLSMLIATFLATVVYAEPIARFLDLPVICIYFIVPFAFSNVLKSFHMQIFRAKRKSKKVRSLSLISGYLGFVLGVLLVYLHPVEERYMGQLWAGLIMMVVSGSIVFYRLAKYIKFDFKWGHLRYMFSFGVPLMPAYLSGFILAQFDTVMIGSYLGKAEAGQYSFAYNISMLMVMVVNALFYSWTPKYFEYMKAENYEQHDKDTLKLLSIISFSACGLILFSDWIGYILGSVSFHKSLYLIPLIIFGQYLMGINPIYKRHISFSKKTIYTSVIVLLAGALNIWLNSIYIPKIGAAAGAYTTVASYMAMLVLTYLAVKYCIKLHVTPVLGIVARVLVVVAVCGFYYVDFYFLELSVFLQIVLKFGLLLVSGLLLLWKMFPFQSGKTPFADNLFKNN